MCVSIHHEHINGWNEIIMCSWQNDFWAKGLCMGGTQEVRECYVQCFYITLKAH